MTLKEINHKHYLQQIVYAKRELQSLDYCVLKIMEQQALGNYVEAAALTQKYTPQLNRRAELREKIAVYEEQVAILENRK